MELKKLVHMKPTTLEEVHIVKREKLVCKISIIIILICQIRVGRAGTTKHYVAFAKLLLLLRSKVFTSVVNSSFSNQFGLTTSMRVTRVFFITTVLCNVTKNRTIGSSV